jgi:hypothetical protein
MDGTLRLFVKESDQKNPIPMSPDQRETLQRLDPGPVDGTSADKTLEQEMKFGYRQVLGEVMYAYVVGRWDIVYPVTTLARYAATPARQHYEALRNVCKYLRATKDWGSASSSKWTKTFITSRL